MPKDISFNNAYKIKVSASEFNFMVLKRVALRGFRYLYRSQKGAMKFIDLSGDSEFESRLKWAKYLRIISKHYADAFNTILLKYYCIVSAYSLQSKKNAYC